MSTHVSIGRHEGAWIASLLVTTGARTVECVRGYYQTLDELAVAVESALAGHESDGHDMAALRSEWQRVLADTRALP